jgi:hypothetical protein
LGKGEDYKYYWKNQSRIAQTSPRRIDNFVKMGCGRLSPSIREPDYLVLRARARLLSKWLKDLHTEGLRVLDVGGRIQPYRPLIEDRLDRYVAIDPILEGLVDVVAVGENLPFPNDSFDVRRRDMYAGVELRFRSVSRGKRVPPCIKARGLSLGQRTLVFSQTP